MIAAPLRATASRLFPTSSVSPSGLGLHVAVWRPLDLRYAVHDLLPTFVKLGEDWDGYGAAPPKPDVLSAAERWLGEQRSQWEARIDRFEAHLATITKEETE